jgi:hypothetical protein
MQYALRISGILIVVSSTIGFGQEQDVRYYEQGGTTYREAKTTIRRPVREMVYQDQQQTYYREKYDTQMHSVQQFRYQPMTYYYWEPRRHGTWNIFSEPHVAYHLRSHTTWQAQTRTTQVPVTQRTYVAETRTVKAAVPKLSLKEEEVVTRMAVGPAASNRQLAATPASQPVTPASQPAIAWNLAPSPPSYGYAWSTAPVYIPATPQLATTTPSWTYGASSPYGGVARLEGDPPRYGHNATLTNAGNWQARRDTNSSR